MNNRTDTWPTHSDVRVGSGREVEAASNVFVPPGGETFASSCGCSLNHPHEHHHQMTEQPSRIDELKTRGSDLANQLKSRSMETMETVKREMSTRARMLKREMSTRTRLAKRSMSRAQVEARDNMTTQVHRMNSSMRTEPMKWAGIAAGSGVVLGLIGRYVHWRMTRPAPTNVVLIEAC